MRTKSMNMMIMKIAHSGCSDPRQIQDGTDTCQGHKLRVHGTRSHNPLSIPAKSPCLRFVVIFYVCLFLLQVLFICLCFLWSPESSEAPEQHCVHRRRRCKRRQTSGPPPWRSLASVEPASEKNVAFDSDLKKHWLGSKFLHLKLAKSVKLGLGAWCAASWNLFKVGTTLRLNFSFNCCNILFEIPQNVPPCWWWFTIYWITPPRPSDHSSSAWRLEIWYKPR